MRESSEDLRPQPQRLRRCRMRPVKKGTGFFLLIFKRGESVMVFSSASFLIFFLPCLLVLYFLVPRRCRYLRNLVLLAFSLAFYACGGPKFLLLMLLSIAINYAGGLLAGPAHRPRTRRLGMTLAVVLGLALLGWFKYAGFFGEMLHALLPVVPVPQVTLPIGISFFTFQGLSYVIDVYRGDAAVQRDPLKLALYIAFFPQLVAGPIVRYTTVAEEIDERHESVSEFSAGAVRFLFGLGKKMLLANAVARIADAAFAAVMPSVLFAWLGAVAYTFQIYFDFSAYSDMAIGLGRMFGFHFLENFNYPYVARSVTEFWRRWHISLSTWFRDYVYIPLGGNRAQCVEPLRRLVPDRNVARRELEFHRLGTLVLCAARGGKAPMGQGSGASAVARAPRLRDGAGRIQLGALPRRDAHGCGGLLRRHVRQQRRVVRQPRRLLRAGVLAGAAVLLHRRAAGEAMAGDDASKAGRRARPRRADVGPEARGDGAAGVLILQARYGIVQSLHLLPVLRGGAAMKKFSEWVMALLFSGTLLVLMAATILLPKERYSYYENRNLSAFPEISVESIASGKVFGELETMFCDYAAWRTAALRAVTWCDLNLFHRPVVNEVVVTPDALLEELYTMPDTAEDIVREADAVAADNAVLRDQIEAYGGYYCYLAVPCQYAYYEDAYPAYLENRAAYTAAERAALREAMEARGIAYVDMGEIFDAEGHLPEFSSKVDNHYGLRGAYVTYRAAAERLAADGCALRVPEEGTDVTFSALPNPYMGSRTRKLLGLRGSDEKLLTASFAEDILFTRFDNGAAAEATVYALPGSDAEPLTYGLYMGGDIAETVIRTDRPELPNALIFGDSFTNPVECLAYYSFNELRSVDLRHYTVQSLSDYIAAYQPDVVLCVRDYQSLLLREFNGDFFS